MPIRVQMPNGTVRPFREGTPKSVIRRAQQDMLADMKASGAYDGFDFSEFEDRPVTVTQTMPGQEETPVPVPRHKPPIPATENPIYKWMWPVPGSPNLNPGDRTTGEGQGAFGTPRSGGRTHAGIDITADEGSSVLAAAPGKILAVGNDPGGYGQQVTIDHGNGIYSHYAHLGTIDARVGEDVMPGQRIGAVGRTGNPPKGARTHLDFEVRIGSPKARSQGGTVIDPLGPQFDWQHRE